MPTTLSTRQLPSTVATSSNSKPQASIFPGCTADGDGERDVRLDPRSDPRRPASTRGPQRLTDEQRQLAEDHVGVARGVVKRSIGRIPPGYQLDEAFSAAAFGLIDAAGRFRPEGGASFETCAWRRATGEILDDLRRFTPGRYRDKMRPFVSLNSSAAADEAGDGGVPKARAILDHRQPADPDADIAERNPDDTFWIGTTAAFFAWLTDGIPDRPAAVLWLARVERVQHRDIAAAVGVSVSQVDKDLASAEQYVRANRGAGEAFAKLNELRRIDRQATKDDGSQENEDCRQPWREVPIQDWKNYGERLPPAVDPRELLDLVPRRPAGPPQFDWQILEVHPGEGCAGLEIGRTCCSDLELDCQDFR